MVGTVGSKSSGAAPNRTESELLLLGEIALDPKKFKAHTEELIARRNEAEEAEAKARNERTAAEAASKKLHEEMITARDERAAFETQLLTGAAAQDRRTKSLDEREIALELAEGDSRQSIAEQEDVLSKKAAVLTSKESELNAREAAVVSAERKLEEAQRKVTEDQAALDRRMAAMKAAMGEGS